MSGDYFDNRDRYLQTEFGEKFDEIAKTLPRSAPHVKALMDVAFATLRKVAYHMDSDREIADDALLWDLREDFGHLLNNLNNE